MIDKISEKKSKKQTAIKKPDPVRPTRLSKELINTSTYGLEYVLDEIFEEQEKAKGITKDSKIDWFGLSDLTRD